MNAIEHFFVADLRGVPEEKLDALRRESVRTGVPLREILGRIIEKASDRMIKNATPAPKKAA